MKIVISFKIAEKIKDKLQELAEKENRSLSNYIVTLLVRHLEEKGIEWREETEEPRKKKPKK